MPSAGLPHLFDPFYCVSESRTRNAGGTGIGLTIVERIVALHCGKVSAANATPSGLRIRLELPVLS